MSDEFYKEPPPQQLEGIDELVDEFNQWRALQLSGEPFTPANSNQLLAYSLATIANEAEGLYIKLGIAYALAEEAQEDGD